MSLTNPKDNSRKRGDARARRIQRQLEAEARGLAVAKLTPEDRLAALEARPGDSARERRRLLSAIESRRRVIAKKGKDG